VQRPTASVFGAKSQWISQQLERNSNQCEKGPIDDRQEQAQIEIADDLGQPEPLALQSA
jgi:hypothetical protein